MGFRGDRPKLRGTASYGRRSTAPVTAEPPRPLDSFQPSRAEKKKILFVCIGNSCRSQMAEAFARAYGSDVMIPQSAGLNPATIISPLTQQTLGERNIRLDGHFPKGVDMMARETFDLVVNISGQRLPLPAVRMIEWAVPDPIGRTNEVYRNVAGQIESLVIGLILELRASLAAPATPARPPLG